MIITLSPRSFARLMSVQALFCHLSRPEITEIKTLCDHLTDCHPPGEDPPEVPETQKCDQEHRDVLISSALEHKEEHYRAISNYLSVGWKIERIGLFQQAILMVAMTELTHCLDVPYRVIIDEYVTIASWFLDSKEVTFINAVLDKFTKSVRANEVGAS